MAPTSVAAQRASPAHHSGPQEKLLRSCNGTTSESLLEDLSTKIQENACRVSSFLRCNGHSLPSFNVDAPATTLPASAPTEIHAARQALMEAALQTFQLAAGPSEYLPHLAVGYQYVTCLQWLTHFGIFPLVPLTGSVSYSVVAAAANVSEKQLKTVARMVMTNHVFCEPEPDTIAHTATSALLVTNPMFHNWASFICETTLPMASKLVEASERWPGSVETNQTAYNVAFETGLPFFDHLATLPDLTEKFACYMKNVQNSQGTAIHHLLRGYDWAALGKATVVDVSTFHHFRSLIPYDKRTAVVGGSTGAASIALARAFPDLDFIVQDLPDNVANGEAALAEQPSSIKPRISFQAHDFFEDQPHPNADVYLLRMILHDWPQREATAILKRLVPALKKSSRIIIMDTVLPQPGSIPSAEERLLRVRDMTMLQAFNSQERDLKDWTELLKGVDERLSLVNVVQPVGSVMSAMEVAFEA
ncbi:S-adenosyl-L-methionine-dependent methyltransferase [Penicillium viridicatum]|nr:S-adenosyl-L-methionine-dependent methyltransferase [Penicillium viridicatum]